MTMLNGKYDITGSEEFVAFFDNSNYLKKLLTITEDRFGFDMADAMVKSWLLCFSGGLLKGVKEGVSNIRKLV